MDKVQEEELAFGGLGFTLSTGWFCSFDKQLPHVNIAPSVQ